MASSSWVKVKNSRKSFVWFFQKFVIFLKCFASGNFLTGNLYWISGRTTKDGNRQPWTRSTAWRPWSLLQHHQRQRQESLESTTCWLSTVSRKRFRESVILNWLTKVQSQVNLCKALSFSRSKSLMPLTKDQSPKQSCAVTFTKALLVLICNIRSVSCYQFYIGPIGLDTF